MRTTFLLFPLLIAHTMAAQEAWRSILSVDPEMSNGYFILDAAKCEALQVEQVEVELLLHKFAPGSGYATHVLGSVSMAPTDH